MLRSLLPRWAFVALILAGLAVLLVRKDDSSDSISPRANASASTTQHSLGGLGPSMQAGGSSAGPYTFSQAYDYCYVDAEGRPMVFQRRRLVLFLPEAPGLDDRTFVTSGDCQ